MIKKVAFVAHPTRDIEKANRFWREAVGLEPTASYGDYWTEYGVAGTTFALDTFSPQASPDAAPYLALETDDIAAECEKLVAAGAQMLKEPWANQDQDGKDVCKMAFLLDPDGNPFMLHEIAPERA